MPALAPLLGAVADRGWDAIETASAASSLVKDARRNGLGLCSACALSAAWCAGGERELELLEGASSGVEKSNGFTFVGDTWPTMSGSSCSCADILRTRWSNGEALGLIGAPDLGPVGEAGGAGTGAVLVAATALG